MASLIHSLEIGDSFESTGPVAKIRKMANSGALPGQINDFAHDGEELSVTRQAIESLPIVASG